jgi:hypothetical protein
MSTPLSDAAADTPAERDLFTALIDDAAVFPPGNAPLEVAVQKHRRHCSAPYADLVGPLLVPPSAVASLSDIVDAEGQGSPPLHIRITARPGTDQAVVDEAVKVAGEHPRIEVAGLETAWTRTWRDTRPDGLPLVLEVPRGEVQAEVLADVASATDDSANLLAKFRTGATPDWSWPDETELATFIRTSIDQDLGFKLTGGLHHAVRGAYAAGGASGEPEEQHGLLNVVAAVRWALNGEDVDELVPLLGERDPAVLVPMIERMSVADAAIVRAFLTAYGCCEVTDPIRELTELNLIDAHPHRR